MNRARGAWLIIAIATGCATGGTDLRQGEGGGSENLPSAGVGPFRQLTPDEVKGLAPFVLDDSTAVYREPAVLRDGEVTFLYAVARVASPRGEVDAIVRTRALDERTFFGTNVQFGKKPLVVLEPDALWEGRALGGPSLLRLGSEVLLYYGGPEGIGVARSTDGRAFRKEPGPILGRDALPGSWETSAPRAPTVYALPDGRLRMLYSAGSAIGEAESGDGVTWRRLRGAPVLSARPPAPAALLGNQRPPFDEVAVGDPCAVTRTTPAGRFHVRVLYTGVGATGATAIGFAARYGDTGPLERQVLPVYSVGQGESAPAFLDLGATSYLYVAQERRDITLPYFGIAAAVAPVTVTLPPASDFPDAP